MRNYFSDCNFLDVTNVTCVTKGDNSSKNTEISRYAHGKNETLHNVTYVTNIEENVTYVTPCYAEHLTILNAINVLEIKGFSALLRMLRLLPDEIYALEERIAILEFDAEMERKVAEMEG
jgi:hypothetical protein